MEKVLKKFMAMITVVMMFVTILPLNFKHAEAADDSVVITFKSKLLYDIMVEELRNSSGIYSVDEPNLRVYAKQTAVDNVESIEICYYEKEKITLDLTGIEYFKNCTYFYVQGVCSDDGESYLVTIPDLTPVTKLTKLESLRVIQAKVQKFPSLQGLKELNYLELVGISDFDVSIISGMTSLKDLELVECDIDNEDVKIIGSLTSLECLFLRGSNKDENNISDITPLKNLTNLVQLDLETNNISDISPLRGLTNMVILSLGGNQISDLSPLSKMTSLAILYLDSNNVGNPITSMEPITNLPIYILSASYCNIKDISFVDKMTALEYLDLGGNSIEDFSPLEDKDFCRNLYIYKQNYTSKAVAGDKVILPEAIARALDPTFIGYDEESEYVCSGCQISADHKTITINPDATSASVFVANSFSDRGVAFSSFTVDVEPIKVELTSNLSKINIGDSVKLTATARSGYDGIKYSFLVYNKDTGAWYRFNKDFVTDNTLLWTAKTAENRNFYVEAKDSKGNVTRSKNLLITVNEREPLSVKATASETNLYVGDTIKLTANTSGGSENYTYRYMVYNSLTNEWYTFNNNFINSNTFTWKASSEGARMFYIEVKDTIGNVVRSEAVKVNVKKAPTLSVYGTASESIINVGDKLTITGKASGGKGNYTYSYLIYNPSTKEWYRVNKVFTSNNTYTWKAGTSGARVFYVEVKDAGGTIVRSKGINVTVK